MLFIDKCFAFCGGGAIFALIFRLYKKSIGKLFGSRIKTLKMQNKCQSYVLK